MLSFRTQGYNGYACKYSPFYDNKIAVATSANYGLVGNGKLFVLSIGPDGRINQEAAFDTQDGLFDVSWSELHENQVLACSGDGSISLFDTTLPNFPIKRWQEHQREVFSVYWNLVEKSTFCSSSWDGTIKVWSPHRQESMLTLVSHIDETAQIDHAQPSNNDQGPPLSNRPQIKNPNNNCVYQAQFSPHDPSILISVNAASHCQLWDTRAPNPLCLDFVAHRGMEILTCDYNKYRPTVLATGSVDKSIKIWDIRMISNIQNPKTIPHRNKVGPSPINKLIGHDFAVRKIQWSPHDSDVLMSCSYDMTCKVWKDITDEKASFIDARRMRHGDALIGNFDRHREFVMGCDWSLWGRGFVASVGWDEMVNVWKAT